MIGKAELQRAFENKAFVTKGYVMQRMDYKKYEQVNPFFDGLEHIGQKYLTEDVIKRILEYREYED